MSPAAGARAAAYALFSALTDSPFGAESGGLPAPRELAAALAELTARLPFEVDFAPLAAAAREIEGAEIGRLASVYGALFEVGSDGPPAPLREELHAARPLKAKEEVLRFYDFFGYRLDPEERWAPDRLSVELEFLHLLAFREERAGAPEERLSLRRAQRDFLERHPASWVPAVRRALERLTAEPWYRALFATLESFLASDLAWLRRAVAPGAPGELPAAAPVGRR